MKLSANFEFLNQEFPFVAESASHAERHVYGDPRASCFYARHALERLVMRVYKVDKTLSTPEIMNLDGYLGDPTFTALVPQAVLQKAQYIRNAGNSAVHGKKIPESDTAMDIVRELFHVCSSNTTICCWCIPFTKASVVMLPCSNPNLPSYKVIWC